MTLQLGEFELIERIRRGQVVAAGSRTILGIGDDCAALALRPGEILLATTDMLMDGRHFLLDLHGAEAAGYKALGVNVSDIAAMAGLPIAALVAVALPRDRAEAVGEGLNRGVRVMADRFGIELIGGDTNAWDGPLVISVTVLGVASRQGIVTRSGARAGDAILVTGPLGGSLESGRHLRVEPRVELARQIQELAPIHAMIDISDGLVGDLGHILEESGGPGAVLEAEAIPIHEDAQRAALAGGRGALERALGDGEDFELCLTMSEAGAERVVAAFPGLRRIGWITADPRRLIRIGGRFEPWPAGGFDHLRAGCGRGGIATGAQA